MTKRNSQRPCWVVLAPGKRAQLESEILRIYGRTGSPCPWQITDGSAGYLSVLEFEPGSECVRDEELAKALSSRVSEPVYVLWLNDEAPRVQAFIGGVYAGEIAAWPDSVAAQLGCGFPKQIASGGPAIDLTPRKAPSAGAAERKIGGRTAAQWKHDMRFDEWSVLLDGASDKTVDEVIAALSDTSAAVRLIACKLAGAMSVDGLGERADHAQAILASLAQTDRDAKVRAAAAEVSKDLREAISRERVRTEFPWIVNFHPDALQVALATLDDSRVAVRRELYSWWGRAWEIPSKLRPAVVAKLETRLAQEVDAFARKLAESALDNLQRRR